MEQLAQSLQRLKPAPMRRVWRQLLGDLASLLAGVRQCVMLDYVLLTPAQVRRTSRVRRALPPPSPRGLYRRGDCMSLASARHSEPICEVPVSLRSLRCW